MFFWWCFDLNEMLAKIDALGITRSSVRWQEKYYHLGRYLVPSDYRTRPWNPRKLESVVQQETVAPLNLWLQLHCEDELGATWTEKQVYPEDVEYVRADEIRRALKGHRCSELWGDNGLIAATMRCVDAVGKIEDLVTTDHETKEAFIQRVRGVLSLPNVDVLAPAGEKPHPTKSDVYKPTD
jgi:hypothetical protein